MSVKSDRVLAFAGRLIAFLVAIGVYWIFYLAGVNWPVEIIFSLLVIAFSIVCRRPR